MTFCLLCSSPSSTTTLTRGLFATEGRPPGGPRGRWRPTMASSSPGSGSRDGCPCRGLCPTSVSGRRSQGARRQVSWPTTTRGAGVTTASSPDGRRPSGRTTTGGGVPVRQALWRGGATTATTSSGLSRPTGSYILSICGCRPSSRKGDSIGLKRSACRRKRSFSRKSYGRSCVGAKVPPGTNVVRFPRKQLN